MTHKECRDEFLRRVAQAMGPNYAQAYLKLLTAELDGQISKTKFDAGRVEQYIANLRMVKPQSLFPALDFLKGSWGGCDSATQTAPTAQNEVTALLADAFSVWAVVNWPSARRKATQAQQTADGKISLAINSAIAVNKSWKQKEVMAHGQQVENNKAGCCTSLSLAVARRLLNNGFSGKHRIEIVANHAHTFVVIDRAKGTEKGPPAKWGKDAFIVDLWFALKTAERGCLISPASKAPGGYNNSTVFFDSHSAPA